MWKCWRLTFDKVAGAKVRCGTLEDLARCGPARGHQESGNLAPVHSV